MNNSSNETCPLDASDSTPKDHIAAKVALACGYLFILCLSLCGNSLVCYVVFMNRHMQTVTNIFITNLATADIIQTLTSLWLTPVHIYLRAQWLWGKPACFLFPMFQSAGVLVSTYTLSAIALDRYIVIVHPMKPRMRVVMCLSIIACIWALSLTLSVPLVVHMKHVFLKSCDFYVCYENWSDLRLRNFYGTFVMIIQWVVPFAVIATCYMLIFARLSHRPQVQRQHLVSDNKRKRRLNKMLLCMVIIFCLCWLPINTVNIVRDAIPNIFAATNWFTLLFLITHFVAMSSTCWNPLLYAWFNDNFRNEFRNVLPCFRCRQNEVEDGTQSPSQSSRYRLFSLISLYSTHSTSINNNITRQSSRVEPEGRDSRKKLVESCGRLELNKQRDSEEIEFFIQSPLGLGDDFNTVDKNVSPRPSATVL